MRKQILGAALFTLIALGMAQAQRYKFSTLYTFHQNGKDPRNPNSLIIDPAGNLYGSSSIGGVFKQGTVFELTPQGVLTVLHNFDFSALNPTNVVRDSHGILYGATAYDARVAPSVVFKLAPEQTGAYGYSVVYTSADEAAEVALDSAGNIFGLDCGQQTGGPDCSSTSLFEIQGGSYETLATLLPVDSYPFGNLVIDKAGNVYGTISGNGSGTDLGYVYEWSPQSGFSVLHAFDGTDGSWPGALTMDAAGNLYGVTNEGINNGAGTVFKISPTTGFSTLYTFCSLPNCADGSYPGSIVLDSHGNIFGTALSLVFKITPEGAESVIYNSGAPFVGNGLVIDQAGNLYGFKTRNQGSIYKLTLVN